MTHSSDDFSHTQVSPQSSAGTALGGAAAQVVIVTRRAARALQAARIRAADARRRRHAYRVTVNALSALDARGLQDIGVISRGAIPSLAERAAEDRMSRAVPTKLVTLTVQRQDADLALPDAADRVA